MGGYLRADAVWGKRLVHDQQPAGFVNRASDGVDVQGGHGPRIDQLDGNAVLGQLFASLKRLVDHQGEGDHSHVAAFADHRGFAELDLVILFGDRAFDGERLAVFEEEHRVVAAQRPLEQALGVVRGRGQEHAEAGEMGIHRIVVAGVVRGGRVTDPNAAAEQNLHLQPAAAHVLHLGDLVNDLADRVENEVGEHEVDDRPRPGHGRATADADEAALGCRPEVATPLADALAKNEDARVLGHLFGERFQRGLHEGDLPAARLGNRQWLGRRLG